MSERLPLGAAIARLWKAPRTYAGAAQSRGTQADGIDVEDLPKQVRQGQSRRKATPVKTACPSFRYIETLA